MCSCIRRLRCLKTAGVASSSAICCYTTNHPQILGLKQQCFISHYSVGLLYSVWEMVEDQFHVV